MTCPRCGAQMEQETVDVGIGDVPIGPYGCFNCRYIDGEDSETDSETGGEG